ncbi:hypothetical protein AA12717_1868 [Gluconacetobacter sacchari DSM 12717]|uniref:MFS transporter n=2 Tax=Gluconacetobacter sacchari TaxID=92759 RepID=A0A7W4IGL7_9PROT|nr:MFS transporter [Gluconacetobacter sacchari]MBB2162456.1 MFS transporter [Gluconacetobacter sacchari]GBQ24720.1 hypothetical protein AA12717_1868 [Gluconacetobacter sacchari DSM 12717]
MNVLKNRDRLTQLVFGQFTSAATVYFGVFAVLPVFLIGHTTLKTSTIATVLFAASVMGKLGRVFVSSAIDRLPLRNVLVLSSLTAAAALCILPHLKNAAAICTAITIFNLANGANSVSVRSLTANMKRTTESRFLKYSKLSTATNFAAMIGPPAAFYLLTAANGMSPFYAFALLLAATAAAVFGFRSLIPDLHPQETIVSGVFYCLRLPELRRLLICTSIGYFSYAFMYNSVALYATYHLRLENWGGVLLGLNAVIVIATSYPLNQWMERMHFGVGIRIQLGFGLYLVAFLLPVLLKHPVMLAVAVVLWALAESSLLPSLIGQATVGVPASRHVAALTVYSVVVGIGEGAGAFVAVSLTASSALDGGAGFLLAAGICATALLTSGPLLKGMV